MKKKIDKNLKSLNIKTLNTFLGIVLVALIIFGGYTSFTIGRSGGAGDAPDPALSTIEIILITAADCENCFDISEIGSAIAQMGVDVKSEETLDSKSADATTLIVKYNITKLPTAVITGEIEALSELPFRKQDDALVFDNIAPPYVDVATGDVKGLVSGIALVDNSCVDCNNISLIFNQLQLSGVVFESETTIDKESDEGQRLINSYNIKKIPTIILSEDALDYARVADVWDQAGSVEDDGRLVMRTVPPPYHNLETGDVDGLVTVIFLDDKSCEACYDVELHEQIMASNFGMKFAGRRTLDVDDMGGKDLVEKFNITKVPTIILSDEAGVYPGMAEVWEQVGTLEEDGSYVFRALERAQDWVYKDLSTGKLSTETSTE